MIDSSSRSSDLLGQTATEDVDQDDPDSTASILGHLNSEADEIDFVLLNDGGKKNPQEETIQSETANINVATEDETGKTREKKKNTNLVLGSSSNRPDSQIARVSQNLRLNQTTNQQVTSHRTQGSTSSAAGHNHFNQPSHMRHQANINAAYPMMYNQQQIFIIPETNQQNQTQASMMYQQQHLRGQMSTIPPSRWPGSTVHQSSITQQQFGLQYPVMNYQQQNFVVPETNQQNRIQYLRPQLHMRGQMLAMPPSGTIVGWNHFNQPFGMQHRPHFIRPEIIQQTRMGIIPNLAHIHAPVMSEEDQVRYLQQNFGVQMLTMLPVGQPRSLGQQPFGLPMNQQMQQWQLQAHSQGFNTRQLSYQGGHRQPQYLQQTQSHGFNAGPYPRHDQDRGRGF